MTMTETPAGTRKVVTTDELMLMLARGERVVLPDTRMDEAFRAHYSAEDLARLDIPAEINEVVSVEFVGYEEVQCISVADDDHLYVTDDMIATHNTSNIIFLKSTDDSMIDTMVKMAGTTHVGRSDSKSVRKNAGSFFNFVSVESDVTVTMSVKEEPVISYNDFASLAERNSIVLRAGDMPIWNRNESILPMSWRLFGPKGENTVHSNNDYTLQTIPTLSSAKEFDVRLNQPNFQWMLEKRLLQATKAARAREVYMEAYHLSELEMTRLDPDVLSGDIMGIVDAMIFQDKTGIDDLQGAVESGDAQAITDAEEFDELSGTDGYMDDLDYLSPSEDNDDQMQVTRQFEVKQQMLRDRKYCGGLVTADDIARIEFSEGGGVVGIDHSMDPQVIEAYKSARHHMGRDSDHFKLGSNGSLMSANGRTSYITHIDETAARSMLMNDLADSDRVYSEEEMDDIGSYYVHQDFYTFLANLPTWSKLGDGEFERAMTSAVRSRDEASIL